MSDSQNVAKTSTKKRKHRDEDTFTSGATKKSKVDRTDPLQKRNETSVHISDGQHRSERNSLPKSSESNRRNERRMRKAAEREKAEVSIDVAAKALSTRKRSKDKYKDGRKRRKDYREENGGSSLLKKEVTGKEASSNGTQRGKESEADKKERKQRKADKKARKATANAQGADSKALIRQSEPRERGAVPKPGLPTWTISTSSPGRFLDNDPIFVREENGEQFLVCANIREVQVLSLETSLVARTYASLNDRRVVCLASDAGNSNVIHIAYDDGFVDKWDWTQDAEAFGRSRVESRVCGMETALHTAHDKADLFYVSISKKGYRVFKLDQNLPLYATSQQLSGIRVLGDCEYIVCFGPSTLVIGKKKDKGGSSDDFVFLEIPLSTTATCIDGRLVASNKKGKDRSSSLHLAIGHENGQLHLYENISYLFSASPRQHNTEQTTSHVLPTPRILHWHREAVSSVKFSQDGNYLISGGRETVLVIWQLETGKQQFLPHLTSEMQRIVVSPEGDRYAVQMGDNSIMVLSTSELKPVAHFAGLQMIRSPSKMVQEAWFADRKPVAAALHPTKPFQLLVTVPSSPPKSLDETWSRPFLQTFDTRYSRHISRQALTRNNVTDFTLGPERTPIIPPDAIHIAITHDGKWLATVDEWMPPASDLEHLQADEEDIERERGRRREVYLKIWHWDEQQGIWTLSTRADAPHARANGDAVGAGAVLGLEADPTSLAFATTGEDGVVKLWKPRKWKMDKDFIEWRCTWSCQIPRAADTEVDDGFGDVSGRDGECEACIAFSGDGSLLAVSMHHSSSIDYQTPSVHFIDTFSGMIAASKFNLAKTAINSLGFLGRHFIAVTLPAVYVWDLVEETLVYKAELAPIGPLEHPNQVRRPLLAANAEDSTFAIVVDGQRLEVHGTKTSKCLFKQEFDVAAGAVLSATGRRGFVLVFEDATVRKVAPDGASSVDGSRSNAPASSLALLDSETSATQPLELDQATEVDDAIPNLSASSTRLLKDAEATTTVREQAMGEDDRPVVRPEQLASIFDVPHSFAMPPVKDMFQAVIGLYGRKPMQTVQS